MSRRLATAIVALVVALTVACASPPPARAINVAKPICTLAGLVSGVAGKICSAAGHAGTILKAGKKLLGGHLGGAVESLSGASSAAKALTAGAVLGAIVVWVTGGAKFVLKETAKVISATTRPQLQSTWFSAFYWRMAAISALLTLPFLFAAAIQSLLRSDMSMLARAAFGYLPLGMLAVGIAAPITMLLLSASDELSGLISGASGDAGAAFLGRGGFVAGGLSQISGSTFLLLFVGLLTVSATITLWLELLIRSAAVYVVVLMLPLFFAALVWPARRIWAIRAVELLIALILSKFVIVAVLSLGGAALGHTALPGPTADLAGVTLVMLAAFSPWALMRLLPLHELAGGLEGLRTRSQSMLSPARGDEAAEIADALMRRLPAELPRDGEEPPIEAEATDAALAGLNGNQPLDEDPGGEGGGADQADTNPGSPPPGGAPGAAGAAATAGAPGAAATAGAQAPADEPAAPSSVSPAPPPEPSAADDGPPEGGAQTDRLPGMETVWQAENGAWRTLDLTGESLPSGPLTEPGRAQTEGPHEDHDPLPPAQEPDGGHL